METFRPQLHFLTYMFCLILVLPLTSLAQTTTPAALSPEAQAAVDKGVLAAKEQDYLLAVRYFQDARKLAPQAPEIYYDLGLAESKIAGRELRAIAWFGAYLTANPNATNATAVKEEIDKLDVKSQSNDARLITSVQDAAIPTPQHRYYFESVAGLWAESGDVTAALKIVDLFQDADDKDSIQLNIATGQLKAGDIAGAQKTLASAFKVADSIQDFYIKIRRLLDIAKGQVLAKDSAGAQKTFESALKAADLVPYADSKSRELSDIAKAQADTDNMAGARMTFAAALKNTNQIQDDGFKKYSTIFQIAYTESMAYDIEDAQKTAELLQDVPGNAWKSGAQKRIAGDQELLKLGVGHIPKSDPSAVDQAPIQPAVSVVTVSDFLKRLDDDWTNGDCALNTGPFLDLAGYLKSLPPSDNSEVVFANLRDIALRVVKAQNVIDHMLKQRARQ